MMRRWIAQQSARLSPQKTAPAAVLKRRYCVLCMDGDSPDIEGRILDYLRLIHTRDPQIAFNLMLFARRRRAASRLFDPADRTAIETEIGGRLFTHRTIGSLHAFLWAISSLFAHFFPYCFSRQMVIHTRMTHYGGLAGAIYKFLCLGRPRLIIDELGEWSGAQIAPPPRLTPPWRILDSLWRRLTSAGEWLALRGANLLIGPTAALHREIVNRYPVARHTPYEILPSLADENIFFYEPHLRNLMRAELELARGDQIMLYSGGIETYQGFEETLEVFKFCTMRKENLLLMVAVPEENQSQAEAILSRHLKEEQYFLVSMRHERLNALLNAVDVACMLRPPNWRGAMAAPIKFPEYILSGLPVVITPGIGDYSRLVECEELGLVIHEVEKPARVALEIMNYLETHLSDDHRYKIAWYGRKNLSKTRQIDQLIDCYRRLQPMS